MSKIKVSEVFYSIQGEGRYMGVPSVFLRTFGCNFRCKMFNRDKNEVITGNNPDVDQVIANLNQYGSYESLPLVSTGCDTYAAIYPEFKHLSPFLETDELAQKIVNLLPTKKWQDEHLVITGGEPLLGWQKAYIDLLNHPSMSTLKEITFETNGTQPLSNELINYLDNWDYAHGEGADRQVTFSVSPKLSVSGHSWDEAIRPDVVMGYANTGHYVYLKFVIASEDDAEEALRAIDAYRALKFNGPIYLMPVGGTDNVYAMNNRKVAELAMKHGLRYSDRLQIPLFGNAWST